MSKRTESPEHHRFIGRDARRIAFPRLEFTFGRIASVTPNAEKIWEASQAEVVGQDGTTRNVPLDTILYTIRSHGRSLEVSASSAAHIEQLHQKQMEPGSVFKKSTEGILRFIARGLPKKLPDAVAGSIAVEIETRKPVGVEGVISRQEMIDNESVSQQQLAALDLYKERVIELNCHGSIEEKQQLVASYAQENPNNPVRIGIRGTSLVPFFLREELPKTTKLCVVLGVKPDGTTYELRTMMPGRSMPKLPTDRTFTGENSSEGIDKGVTVESLRQKQASDQQLSPQESQLVQWQHDAQEAWWNVGFVETAKQRNDALNPLKT